MKWFKHSGTASRDARVAKIIAEFGIQGYGLYFYCIELIASKTDSDDLTFELEHDASLIATWTGMDTVLVEKIMHRCVDLDLFGIADNGHLTCFKLIKWIDRKIVGERVYKEMTGKIGDNPRKSPKIGENPLLLDKTRIDKNRIEQKESQAIPEEALSISELLFSLHQGKIDPGYSITEAQKNSWALDIEKLHRIDGRSWENIAEAIRWIKTPGQFWAPNIMSGKKLRDKFPQVWAKMHDKPRVETTEEQLRRLGKIS
jgi:hypothetical protein